MTVYEVYDARFYTSRELIYGGGPRLSRRRVAVSTHIRGTHTTLKSESRSSLAANNPAAPAAPTLSHPLSSTAPLISRTRPLSESASDLLAVECLFTASVAKAVLS